MDNLELISYVYGRLEALEKIIYELKIEIEELKYFNRELSLTT